MEVYIKIIILGILLYTAVFYIRYKIFIKKVKSKNVHLKKELNNKKNIIIAIPCLREQNYIEDTVKHFRKIDKDIPIVIITTQKEIKENIDNKTTTQEVVKNKILPQYKSVYLVDYPYTEGYMAHQLNYMLENLEDVFDYNVELENTYLALYNADSRPSKNTFNEIKLKMQENHKVIQQYSYCMQNYDAINNILKGFSIYQSNFEIKTGLINGYLNSNLFYTHVVGHGLVINMKTLKEMGNFNTDFWCEDIYLGLQLKFNNIKITPLLSLENMETPNTLKNLTKQNSVWFKTTSQFWKMYKNILKQGQTKNNIKGLLGVFNEFRCALNWISFPIILCIALIFSLITKSYLLLLLLIASYLIFISVNTKITINTINILDNKKYKTKITTIINTALATAISNIGPIYSLISNNKEKHKTER